jgi:NADH-quinone oxidoreductase subunit N
LAIIGVLTSVVAVFFYLRIIVMMYMTPQHDSTPLAPVPRIPGLALAVSAVLVFYLGILPTRVLDWAALSISTIF